jgi:hypothetical protein
MPIATKIGAIANRFSWSNAATKALTAETLTTSVSTAIAEPNGSTTVDSYTNGLLMQEVRASGTAQRRRVR